MNKTAGRFWSIISRHYLTIKQILVKKIMHAKQADAPALQILSHVTLFTHVIHWSQQLIAWVKLCVYTHACWIKFKIYAYFTIGKPLKIGKIMSIFKTSHLGSGCLPCHMQPLKSNWLHRCKTGAIEEENLTLTLNMERHQEKCLFFHIIPYTRLYTWQHLLIDGGGCCGVFLGGRLGVCCFL